eukprot:1434698-Amphidinium_carterae.1
MEAVGERKRIETLHTLCLRLKGVLCIISSQTTCVEVHTPAVFGLLCSVTSKLVSRQHSTSSDFDETTKLPFRNPAAICGKQVMHDTLCNIYDISSTVRTLPQNSHYLKL